MNRILKRAIVGQHTHRLYRWIAFIPCLLVLLVAWPGAPVTAEPPYLVSSTAWQGEDRLSISYTGCAGAIVSGSDVSYEQAVVQEVNARRAAQGLPPLKLSNALRDAARYHAADMAQDSYFEHDTHDRVGEQLIRVCDTWSRIGSYYPSPRAENIAAGFTTPQSVVSAWMGSGGHRSNILGPDYREIGVGYVRGGSWRHYWVQDFGTRNGVYPLVINREATSTDSVHVSLYLYGSWDQVRLRNDDGPWSSWRPFSHEIDWTLPASAGIHAVWAEMRSGAQAVLSSDTIALSAVPTLGGLPGEVRFLYSIRERRLLPERAWVTPLNTGNDATFAWQVTLSGGRFGGSPLTGQVGDSFQIVPVDFERSTPGTYRGTATVASTGLDGVQDSPQQIDLILEVVDSALEVVYLPVLSRQAFEANR
jgi:uncharacterized protein YkwD